MRDIPVREIVVFSGNAHLELAHRICDELEVSLSPVDIIRFSNDCLQVQLRANCRQRDVYIVQPLVPPTQDHLMELLLMLDAARGASAAQVTRVITIAVSPSSKKRSRSFAGWARKPGSRSLHGSSVRSCARKAKMPALFPSCSTPCASTA